MKHRPPVCGGTTRRTDANAPKEIHSDTMTLFRAKSALMPSMGETMPPEAARLRFLSAYAAATEDGAFVMLETRGDEEKSRLSWAIVSAEIFPALVRAVNAAGLAAQNGRFSFTHGLPKNFGGEVEIDYASGEKLHYANNQSPVFSVAFASSLYRLFSDAIQASDTALPDASQITSVRFDETSTDGFSQAELLPDENGDYTLTRRFKFEEPEVFESTCTVSAAFMESIRDVAQQNAVLLWHRLPISSSPALQEKALTFVLADGTEITVGNNRAVPQPLSSAFFAIELKLITENPA